MTLVVNVVGVKSGIKLIGLNGVSFPGQDDWIFFLDGYIWIASMLLRGFPEACGGTSQGLFQ